MSGRPPRAEAAGLLLGSRLKPARRDVFGDGMGTGAAARREPRFRGIAGLCGVVPFVGRGGREEAGHPPGPGEMVQRVTGPRCYLPAGGNLSRLCHG